MDKEEGNTRTLGLNGNQARQGPGFGRDWLSLFTNYISQSAHCTCFKQNRKLEIDLKGLLDLGEQADTHQGMSTQGKKIIIQSNLLHAQELMPPGGESLRHVLVIQ